MRLSEGRASPCWIDIVSRSYLESVVRTQRMSPTRATSFKAKPMAKGSELSVMVRLILETVSFFTNAS